MVLLLVGAVLEQQLTRAQGVGYPHRDHQRLVHGELLQHRRLGAGGEAQAAVLLRDDHAEEAFLLQVVPDLLGQVRAFEPDVPGVAHAGNHGALVVDEGLFVLGQAGVAVAQQLVPVGATGEEFAVPAHGARVQGLFLGFRDLGSHLLE